VIKNNRLKRVNGAGGDRGGTGGPWHGREEEQQGSCDDGAATLGELVAVIWPCNTATLVHPSMW
jgi:hypothetical protein